MPTIPIRWSDNTKDLAANLKQGLNQIEATKAAADKMAQSLGGDRLKQAAHNFVAAVNQIGGVERLTNSERERGNALLTKAIEKYRVLGQVAPDALRQLATATQQIKPIPPTFAEKFLGDLQSQVVGVATGFISAQAVIGGFTKVVDLAQASVQKLTQFLGESVQSYAAAEAAQKKLTTALQAQGTAAPEVVDQYNALATQMQRTTVFSDDLTTEMQALLVQVGDVMPSKMQAALTASANLAAGLGVDLHTATTLVAKAAAGHTETLGKYGITVDKAALQTQGFDAVLEAINKQFGGQATAQLETYAGRVQQIANAWDNVKEAVGKAIVNNPIIVKGLRDTADGMNHLDESASGANFTLSNLLNKTREMGGDPVLLDFLILATAYLENAADEANKLAAAVTSIKPPAGFTPDTTPAGFFKPSPADLGGDPGGLGLDQALRRAKTDNAEVQKELEALHKKALAAFEAWFQVGEAATKALSVWTAQMLPSDQIAEGFATVTESVVDLQTAIDETDAVAAGFTRDGRIISGTLDEMRERAKETEEAFRRAFGIMSGLSLGLPPGQQPGNKGLIDAADADDADQRMRDAIANARELRSSFDAVGDALGRLRSLSDGVFGEVTGGIGSMISQIGAAQQATAEMQAAMERYGQVSNAILLQTALGWFNVGVAIGYALTKLYLWMRGQRPGNVSNPGAAPSPINGPNNPEIPHLAMGAFVRRPTLAVVGDAPGGEFVVPARMMLQQPALPSFAGASAIEAFPSGTGTGGGPAFSGGPVIHNHWAGVIMTPDVYRHISRKSLLHTVQNIAENKDGARSRLLAATGARS